MYFVGLLSSYSSPMYGSFASPYLVVIVEIPPLVPFMKKRYISGSIIFSKYMFVFFSNTSQERPADV